MLTEAHVPCAPVRTTARGRRRSRTSRARASGRTSTIRGAGRPACRTRPSACTAARPAGSRGPRPCWARTPTACSRSSSASTAELAGLHARGVIEPVTGRPRRRDRAAAPRRRSPVTVKLGLFTMPFHHPTGTTRTILEEDQEAIVLADRLGLHRGLRGRALQLVERAHHLAAHLPRHPHPADHADRFGTGVINLPQLHPATVAAHAAMFDQLCRGRFIMGIGPGGLVSDLEMFDVGQAELRPQMVIESIEIILKLWAQDPPYEIDGRFWKISLASNIWPEFKVGYVPAPLPEAPSAHRAVAPHAQLEQRQDRGRARLDPRLRAVLPPPLPPRPLGEVRRGLRGGRAAARSRRLARLAQRARHGDARPRPRTTSPIPTTASPSTTASSTSASRQGRKALFMLKPDLEVPDEDVTMDMVKRALIIAGSPSRVLDQLVALREETGHFGTLLMGGHDWDQPELWRRSMELLATDVMPKFSRHASVDAGVTRGPAGPTQKRRHAWSSTPRRSRRRRCTSCSSAAWCRAPSPGCRRSTPTA